MARVTRMISEGNEAEAQGLLRAAQVDTSPASRKLRTQARLQVAGVLVFSGCAVVFFAWTWYVRTFVPLDALSTAFLFGFSLLFAAMVPLGVWALLGGWPHKAALALSVLRGIAAAGDVRMPEVIDQPAPLSAAGLAGTHDFKLLHWQDKPNATWQKLAFVVALLLVPALMVPMISASDLRWVGPLSFARPAFDLLSPPNPWGNLIWIGLCICYTLLILIWLFSGDRGVVADADGLRWITGWLRKRTIRIGWNEVRSFTRLEFRHRWSPKPRTAFVLDCGRAILSWGYDPILRSGDDLPPQSRLLASIIVTRSAVALRQATPCAAVVLEAAGGYLAHRWARRLQMPPGAAVPPSPPGLTAAFRLLTPPSVLRWTLVPLACLPVILYAAYVAVSLVVR